MRPSKTFNEALASLDADRAHGDPAHLVPGHRAFRVVSRHECAGRRLGRAGSRGCGNRLRRPYVGATDVCHHERPPGRVHPHRRHFGLAVLALAMGGFAIGTTEFVTMGLLPQIADGVGVSIPTAGHVISAYAVGVVVGAPVLAFFGARLPRRGLLVALMVAFARRQRVQRAGRQLRDADAGPVPRPGCRTAPTSASPRSSPPSMASPSAARAAPSRW